MSSTLFLIKKMIGMKQHWMFKTKAKFNFKLLSPEKKIDRLFKKIILSLETENSNKVELKWVQISRVK